MRASSLAFFFLLLLAERAWGASPAESHVSNSAEEVKEAPEFPAEEANTSSLDQQIALLDAPKSLTLGGLAKSVLSDSFNVLSRHKLLAVAVAIGIALILWNAKLDRELDVALAEETKKMGREGGMPSPPVTPDEQARHEPDQKLAEGLKEFAVLQPDIPSTKPPSVKRPDSKPMIEPPQTTKKDSLPDGKRPPLHVSLWSEEVGGTDPLAQNSFVKVASLALKAAGMAQSVASTVLGGLGRVVRIFSAENWGVWPMVDKVIEEND